MKKKTSFYKSFCYIGCFLMISSLMLFSYEAVYANEIVNAGSAVAEATQDDAEEDTEDFFSTEGIESGEIHSVKYVDDLRYELDLSVTEPEITTYGTEQTKRGEGVFNCVNSNGTWLFTATLNATFHYNGTKAWTTYGFYSWEYNTNAGFGQSIQKNQYDSEKKKKTKYVVMTDVYTSKGYIGLHTFKLTCTPQGVLNITNSVC